MAWYGWFAVASLYMTNPRSEGALGFTEQQRGTLQGAITFILYLLPVLTGALADRYGFKKMFVIAYAILVPAYFLLGQFDSYGGFFVVFLLAVISVNIRVWTCNRLTIALMTAVILLGVLVSVSVWRALRQSLQQL